MTWAEHSVERLCELLAQGMTARQIAAELGVKKGTVGSKIRRMVALGDARLPTNRRGPGTMPGDRESQPKRKKQPSFTCTGCGKAVWSKAGRCHPCASGQRAMPDDFAAQAALLSDTALMKHYRAGGEVVRRWRKASGVARPAPVRGNGQQRTPAPENFAAAAPHLTKAELKLRFAAGYDTIERWCREEGVKPLRERPLRQNRPGAPAIATASRRPLGRAGDAADYLRRYGPVYRCDSVGRADQQGTHWRRGSAILTDDQIIARAERNGWKPDAWREVRAA